MHLPSHCRHWNLPGTSDPKHLDSKPTIFNNARFLVQCCRVMHTVISPFSLALVFITLHFCRQYPCSSLAGTGIFLRYIWVYSNSFVLEERPKIRRIFLHTPSYSHHFRPLLRPGPHMSRVVPRSETVVTVAEHQPLAKASGLVALGCSSSLLPNPCHLVQPHTTGPFQVAVKECRMTMFLFIHRHGQTGTSSNSSVQTVRDTVHRKKSRKNQIYSATICYDSTILLNISNGTYHYDGPELGSPPAQQLPGPPLQTSLARPWRPWHPDGKMPRKGTWNITNKYNIQYRYQHIANVIYSYSNIFL